MGVTWTVHQHDDVTEWLTTLSGKSLEHAIAVIDMLREAGPGLRRPVVGKIDGSRHSNMKELITKTVRILFAFDPHREAILLVAGDKRNDWTGWYVKNIPVADDRFDEWLDGLKDAEQ